MRIPKSIIPLLAALFLFACTPSPQSLQMTFSSAEEMSAHSWTLEELTADLPDDWSNYNYLILEMKASSPQRFQTGPITPEGWVVKNIQPFPGAWLRFCIPLDFYRELPASAVDMAATYNKARDLGQINIHNDDLNRLNSVTGIGFRMAAPINNPTLEIRSISLAMETPGDTLLQEGFLVDQFGQWATKEWPGKVKTEEELRAAWAKEDRELTPLSDQYSRYGGYKSKAQRKATGFFRTEKIDDRWWFVDPEGYLFLSVGVDCMNASVSTRTKGREYIYEYLKEGAERADFYRWNLEKRYGEEMVSTAWVDKAVQRMQAWGLNTIANWSSPQVYQSGQIPFTLSLPGLRLERGIMGLPDIYDPAYARAIDESIGAMARQYKDNPWLLGYFVGNEQPWPGQESVLCDRILATDNTPIKKELTTFLQREGDSTASRRAFIYNTFDQFLALVNKTLKKHDPNHLNLGMRFGGHTTDELLAIIGKHFDVFSFNCYEMQPSLSFMQRIDEQTGLPIIIGEYHFGVPDRGMAAGIVQVANYQERGNAYRYYNEQGYAHPSLIGAHWFQWIDQANTGRMDGENYNIGLLDITDRPYPEMVEAMQTTHRRLFEIHTGELSPYATLPRKSNE